jgi:signal transduction histidine kinase
MQPLGNPAGVDRWLWLPARSVRLRLTALYGSLFLVSGAGLLAITYLLVRGAATTTTATTRTPGGPGLIATQHSLDLHQQLVQSGIALAIMTIVSAAVGWLVAGRVLRPLRAMTSATRRISEQNLHDRLALQGPADELKDLADTIDGLLERLEAAFESQRRFVANASHELRTPLAMMRTTLDVAVAKPEGVPRQLQALDAKLREDLDHADRLLESFLTLARAQHGSVADLSSVPLERIVGAALAARGDAITDKRIDVHTALVQVCVTGSETLLARMVENVIENAVRHNQPDGFINVACEIHDGTARLIVDSAGAVLDQRNVAQLAQPFRRLEIERTRSENGVGLGLSIVAAVAAAHRGTLELHARAQGGLRVQITLPGATLAHPAGARR